MSTLMHLLHDPDFRAKVAMAEFWIRGLPLEQIPRARSAMRDMWTRDQALVYAATAEDLLCAHDAISADERASRLADAIERAAIDYDLTASAGRLAK